MAERKHPEHPESFPRLRALPKSELSGGADGNPCDVCPLELAAERRAPRECIAQFRRSRLRGSTPARER